MPQEHDGDREWALEGGWEAPSLGHKGLTGAGPGRTEQPGTRGLEEGTSGAQNDKGQELGSRRGHKGNGGAGEAGAERLHERLQWEGRWNWGL